MVSPERLDENDLNKKKSRIRQWLQSISRVNNRTRPTFTTSTNSRLSSDVLRVRKWWTLLSRCPREIILMEIWLTFVKKRRERSGCRVSFFRYTIEWNHTVYSALKLSSNLAQEESSIYNSCKSTSEGRILRQYKILKQDERTVSLKNL